MKGGDLRDTPSSAEGGLSALNHRKHEVKFLSVRAYHHRLGALLGGLRWPGTRRGDVDTERLHFCDEVL